MVLKDKEGLRILKKMISVNCFRNYVHSLTYVCLTVLVKSTREVSTPLCQLLVTVSLIILHFRGPLHTFRNNNKKMCIEERIGSQRMPISCVLKCVDDVLNPDFKPFSFERLIWMPENLSIFTEKLKERNTIKDLDTAKQAIPVNINQAVSMFTAIMKRVSECMNKKVKVTKQYANKQKLKLSVHFEILEEVIQWKIELGMLNSANSIQNCSQESLTAIKLK